MHQTQIIILIALNLMKTRKEFMAESVLMWQRYRALRLGMTKCLRVPVGKIGLRKLKRKVKRVQEVKKSYLTMIRIYGSTLRQLVLNVIKFY